MTTAPSILIVEDERIIAKDLQQTLAAQGYDAGAIASSAEDAIAAAARRCPDLVIMDIRIKGKRDGIEAAQILQRDFGVPVVYLTAHADHATLERAKLTEPYGYLVKPVKPAELRSSIEVALYRHEMDKRSRERERTSSSLLRSIGDAVIALDLAGHVTYMNPVAERLTGTALDAALGRPARELLPIGGTSPVPLLDQGRPLGSMLVLRDVTEQKLTQKQGELGDRLASMQNLAAGVAHEVNNSLGVVIANADFVLKELVELRAQQSGAAPAGDTLARLDEVLRAQGELQAGAQRIYAVMADLKAFSRPVAPVEGEADVRRALGWALHATAQELSGRARLTTRLPELPPVQADEVPLGQVLAHLLTNAAHSITPGDPEHNEIVVGGYTEPAGAVVLEVRDSGAGMSPEVQQHIFEPFFSTDAPGAHRGLGLAVCHGLVRSVGGEIQVESAVGQGSTFRIRLPQAARPAPRPETRALRTAAPLRGRILVVDDDDLVRRSIQRMLRGQDVAVADDGCSALELLQAGNTFDLIFSDVVMPRMGGIELYEALLAGDPDQARRVVFMSGGALTARADDFFRTVPNRRIEKPFTGAQLLELVQQCLAERTQS
jgi:signal transduction histidine kinase